MASISSVMNPAKYIAGFLFPFVLISCNSADHRIPTKINVDRGEFGPKHSLYQHHDIMLLGGDEGFNDAFGLAPDLTVQIEGEEALAFSRSGQNDLLANQSSAQSGNDSWKKRVYSKGQRERVNVFDLSKIEPKDNATRPAWLGDKKPVLPCQKPLIERKITRLDENGKPVRSYRRQGSVN